MRPIDIIEQINSKIHDAVWGVPTIIALITLGFYFSAGTGFLQIRQFPLMIKKTFGSLFTHKKRPGGISPFKAMSAALAGTIGTGNIVGVGTAIAAGGPGAVFWMWVSAFFGMMTKFAEVSLAVKYREKAADGWRGGPMYYMVNGLSKWAKPLAVIFSVCCMFASFGIGNMAQVNAIGAGLSGSFGVNRLSTGIVTAALCMTVISGGVRRVTDFTGALVPFMSLLYLAGAFFVLFKNASAIHPAFLSIIKGGFSFTAAGGGALGYTAAQAMRYGVSRGVFTNEAGMGSAPIAHASADARHPVEQGFWGAVEVFFDTILVCTVTALVILTSAAYQSGGEGTILTTAAFSEALPAFGGQFVSVSVALFAFASIISWSLYGERACEFLFGNLRMNFADKKQKNLFAKYLCHHSQFTGKARFNAAVTLYRMAFFGALVLGAVTDVTLVWNISDTLNGLMALPNMLALVLLSPRVFALVKEYSE
ncbi:MAG: sodium:alanine symporter family protein [Oscillospiraceae bacterium]|nr:sodium:alanine symporter family protein [Oscillospiraceae bacterium]